MHPPRFSALVAVLALTGSGLAACTGNVAASEADADTSSVRALLVVEQSAPVSAGDAARSQASLWFLRATDDTAADDATRLVTDELQLPQEGECIALGPRPAAEIPATLSPVELAFAGDVQIQVGSSRTELAVRAFPDVAGMISGVVYTARKQTMLDLATDRTVRIQATGAAEMPPFSALSEAPPMPTGLTVDGFPASNAELTVHRGRPFTLTWTSGAASDLIYVDVVSAVGDSQERVRCVASDAGRMQLPASAVPDAEAMVLTVHRVRDAALRTESGDAGTAHFDLAVTARVAVAGP